MVRFRERSPFLFCLFAMGAFLVALLGISYVVPYLGLERYVDDLFLNVIFEMLEFALTLWIILASGLGYVLKRQGNGLGSGLMAGAYFIVIGMAALSSGWAMVKNYDLYAAMGIEVEEKHLLGFSHIVFFFLLMIFVGLAEEFLYRAIVAETLIKKWGCTKSGIIKAAFTTGILFGFTHMVNARVTGLLSATVQAISASVLGIVLTLAYYISGNIWSVVLLHAWVDCSGMFFNGGVYGTGSIWEMTDSMQYSWINLIGVIPYFVVILVLLRKRSIQRIQTVYGCDNQEERMGIV